MLTTAKSIQLLDASGMNVSPITDITSLYYEKPTDDGKMVARKYIYDGFPVAVNITNNGEVNIGRVKADTNKRHPDGLPLYENGEYYKIINASDNSDILISNVSTSIIPGTTYRLIDVYNYNLSNILAYYTPLDLLDASIENINSSLDTINTNINDISNRINDISIGLHAEKVTLNELIGYRGCYVPNKFYLIIDYYDPKDGGCMDLPPIDNLFTGPNINASLSVLVKANDKTNLDYKLYNMYDNADGVSLDIYGTYDIINDLFIQITYLKDKYGNEAPYDFYNLKYNNKYTFNKSNNASNYLLTTNTIKNNIIKSNPFIINNQILLCSNSDTPNIQNNYIDTSTIINADCNTNSTFLMSNNKIYNDCSIYIKPKNIVLFNNNIIKSNNIINLFVLNSGVTYNIFNDNIIENNNIINKYSESIEKLTINSSNSLTLYNNTANAIILNNCDASINLSDHIIIDGYNNPLTTLNTSPNCAYLFNLNVYAKSFNTLK